MYVTRKKALSLLRWPLIIKSNEISPRPPTLSFDTNVNISGKIHNNKSQN